MTDRAHIRLIDSVWTFQKAFNSATGFFRIVDGRRVDLSKAPIGYEVGNDRLVAAVETLDDTSTGSETITERPEWTVAADGSGCSRTVTIRDKTAQEISDEKDAIIDYLTSENRDLIVALGLFVKDLTAQQFSIINLVRTNNGQGTITLAQYESSINSQANKDLITNQQFKNQIKARMS